MSLGIGAGDFIAIPTLALKVYRMCRDSSDEFKRVSKDLSALHTALLDTQEHLEDNVDLSPTRRERLASLKMSIEETLKELEELLNQYESMSTPAQSTWDKVRWGLEDVSSIRDRVITATTELQVLNQMITNSSQKTINKKLDRLLKEVRAGLREGSCVSVQTVESVCTIETWKELRRELETVGLTTTAINENREYITAWFQKAINDRLLEEQDPSENPFINSPPSLSATTLVDTNSDASNSRKPSEASVVSIQTDSATQSRKSSTVSTLSLSKRKNRLGSLVFKMFKSDSVLLEAASDGDTAKVAELIRKGANVNVKDQWGWAPMSMAAYGGYEDIAKMLMEEGADLEYHDVDGDTPLTLATNKGRTGVVLLIEEELQRRTIQDA